MKNSARYHKLWRKKLDQLPIKEDANSAWTSMNTLLDKHLPAGGRGGSGGSNIHKLFNAKGISVLSYLVPAVAIVSIGVYVATHHIHQLKPKHNKEKQHTHALADSLKNTDSVETSFNDSTNIYTGKIAKDTFKSITNDAGNKHSVSASSNGNAVAPAGQLAVQNGNTLAKTSSNVPGIRIKSESSTHYSNTQQNTYNRLGINQTSNHTGDNNGLKRSHKGTKSTASFYSPRAKDSLILPLKNAGEQLAIMNSTTASGHHYLNGITLSPFDVITGNEQDLALLAAKGTDVNDNEKDQSSNKNKSADKSTTAGKVKSDKSKLTGTKSSGTSAPSPLNFGLEAGLGPAGKLDNYYLGALGSYNINEKLSIGTGLRLDMNRTISGSHTHSSYFRPDSATFPVKDSRKVNSIVIPVQLGYKLSDKFSIHGGAQINYLIKQGSINSKLGTVINSKDTLGHTTSIDSAFKHTSINKVTFGISAGVSMRVGHFYIDGTYQQNISPYKVNTGLGTYNQNYGSFQIGILYKLKK